MAGVLVKALSQRECYTIDQSANIKEAASKLAEFNIGAMPVMDGKDNIVGIISERDLSKSLTKEPLDLDSGISSIMTKAIISCDLEISVSELMETMTKHKIRHMPIIDNHKLVGIVSIGDVFNHVIEKYEAENDSMRNYINGLS